MNETTPKSRQRKLKRELDKSLSKLRLSKKNKITSADKNKIKKTAAVTLQRFLKAEFSNSLEKTYDWYFLKKEDGNIGVDAPRRNTLGHNRYFVIDHVDVPINTAHSFASYVSHERVKEYKITNKEISDIISGSKKLFAHMMKVTVSAKEDAKIHKAFDNVDERMIFTVTLGFPIAVITAIEALPFLIAEGQLVAGSGTYFKSLAMGGSGLGLSLNTGLRSSLASGFGDATAQYVGNGFDMGEVDPYKAMVSGVFKTGAGSSLLRSSFNTEKDDFYKLKMSDPAEIVTDFSLGLMGNSVNKSVGNFGLTEFNRNMGGFLEQSLKIGVNGTKTAISVEIRKNSKKN